VDQLGGNFALVVLFWIQNLLFAIYLFFNDTLERKKLTLLQFIVTLIAAGFFLTFVFISSYKDEAEPQQEYYKYWLLLEPVIVFLHLPYMYYLNAQRNDRDSEILVHSIF